MLRGELVSCFRICLRERFLTRGKIKEGRKKGNRERERKKGLSTNFVKGTKFFKLRFFPQDIFNVCVLRLKGWRPSFFENRKKKERRKGEGKDRKAKGDILLNIS